MRLQYKLFGSVAVIFIVAFGLSFYLEGYLVRRNLDRLGQELIDQLYVVNEKQRGALADYLSDRLSRLQAQIDALLLRVDEYSSVRSGFEATALDQRVGSWLESSSLMVTNRWIDLIQNRSGRSQILSQIVSDLAPLSTTVLLSPDSSQELNQVARLDRGIGLFMVQADPDRSPRKRGWDGPYVGVELSIHTGEGDGSDHGQVGLLDGRYFALFTSDQLRRFKGRDNLLGQNLDLSINLLEPFLKWIEIDTKQFYMKPFIQRLLRAQKWVNSGQLTLPALPESIAACDALVATGGEEDGTDLYLSRFLSHENRIGLIWGLSMLAHSNLFGPSPLGADAPLGIALLKEDGCCGYTLRSAGVFFDQPLFAPEVGLDPDGGLELLLLRGLDHLFLGRTLRLGRSQIDQKREGGNGSDLTVAVHGDHLLSSLSRVTKKYSIILSHERVITGWNPRGEEVDHTDPILQAPVKELLASSKGVVEIGGVAYLFIQVQPDRVDNLHVFIFTPKEEAFAFITKLKASSRNLLNELSTQMRLITLVALVGVLYLLIKISQRITRPITHLAEVTAQVAAGRLHTIVIPSGRKRRRFHDEVYTLYHAFFDMVEGLKEKERVRGILNKVVSKEIAEETLKGKVHLGGEERWVTILFADIRHFTALTEKITPQEVIELVNSVMTKVSDLIDHYGGVIDKYVGDEVMALFGAPLAKQESALQAVRSGLAICRELTKWNIERAAQGLCAVEMGVGIHTGNVVAGNMGAENRLNYTVLGANVNLAARLCSQAGGMEILISDQTLQEPGVQTRVTVTRTEQFDLKGFSRAIRGHWVEGLES